jgi:hypothetical protein
MRATCVGELSTGEEHFPRGIITNTEGGDSKPGKGVGGNVFIALQEYGGRTSPALMQPGGQVRKGRGRLILLEN